MCTQWRHGHWSSLFYIFFPRIHMGDSIISLILYIRACFFEILSELRKDSEKISDRDRMHFYRIPKSKLAEILNNMPRMIQ